MSGVRMKREDWSDFAKPTGPDTRQPEMVSREKVLAAINRWSRVWGMSGKDWEMLKEDIRKL